jgi:hypothetical protein
MKPPKTFETARPRPRPVALECWRYARVKEMP